MQYLLYFLSLIGLWHLETPPQLPQKQAVTIEQSCLTDYSKMWKQIEEFEKTGRTKDALKLTEKIYAKAKEENNGTQTVKALLYVMKYNGVIEEKSDSLNMVRLKKELAAAKPPVKQILNSILGEAYWQYYADNRWQYGGRTRTENFSNDDYQTWDASAFMEHCYQHHLAALQDKEALQKISIDEYKELLYRPDTESPKYRPTLYDLLAHRAIDFFRSSDFYVSRPAYRFELNRDDAFADATSFANATFESKDTSSADLQVTHIFQTLLKQHKDAPARLIDIELKRLGWAKERATGDGKDSAYFHALEKLAAKYPNIEEHAMVMAEIANLYQNRAANYHFLNAPQYRNDYQKAWQICADMQSKFPKSRGANRCADMQKAIEMKEISAEMEAYYVPNTPIRAAVRYRNAFTFYVRIIKRTEALQEKLNQVYKTDAKTKILAGQAAEKSWEIALPKETDYQAHSTNITVPAMPSGRYYLLISDNPKFESDKHALTFTGFETNNIAFSALNRPMENSAEYFVSHRKTGEPLAQVQITEFIYDYNKRGYVKTGRSFVTDKNGACVIPNYLSGSYYNNNTLLDFEKNGETLHTSEIYRYNYEQNPQPRNYTIFFTDRKIYRPGQTIYFKGISLVEIDGKSEIQKNRSTNVIFRDANYQEVARIALTTNEYGSFQGTFTAPTSGMMGQMSIADENNQSQDYFRVEEYKRPKFEVTFKDLEGSYKLGDKVTAKGTAMGYAGNAVDGAEVKYRVVRRAVFPYWGYYRWWQPAPSSPEMEITNGTAKTDAEGNFSIEFEAIPDNTLSKADKPQFNYTVYADVVDITGETHSAEQGISLGYIALSASLSIADLEKSKADSATINTTNLMGTFEPAKGKVEIYRLENPSQWFRNNSFQEADVFMITETDFRKNFPYEVYKKESDFRNWKKGEKEQTITFDTEKNKKYPLAALQTAKTGKYVAELTTADKYGNEVKVIEYFMLNDEKENMPALPTPLTLQVNKTTFEPNENAIFTLETSEKSRFVVFQIEQNGKLLDRQYLNLLAGKKTISFPIKEEYRGGFTASVAGICENEFHSQALNISVPWTNKELKMTWSTFRNKLLPGAKEEWQLKITGAKSEVVAAEMVATMYDASLDMFSTNDFLIPNFHKMHYLRMNWEASQGFGHAASCLLADDWNTYSRLYNPLSYDALNLFGFYMGRERYYNVQEVMVTTKSTKFRPRLYKNVSKESLDEAKMDMAAGSPPPPPVAMAAPAMEISANGDGISDILDKAYNTPENGKDAEKEGQKGKKEVQIRKNLQETAFFFPQLRTNEKGEIILAFTMPEALTKWKMLGFAHTQDLQTGDIESNVVTQKDLMIQPNAPRFLREGDKFMLSAKVSNLSDKDVSGTAELKIMDAFTGKDITNLFGVKNNTVSISAKSKQSALAAWEIAVPENIQAVIYQVVASGGDFSDGEENALPVVLNKMLVTESLPLPIRGNSTKTFIFKNLAENKSTTLRNQLYTLEFTSNPAWYAVQALPYLMEYPHECTEQMFSRYYANALASHIANSTPRVKQVFEQWAKDAKSPNNAKQALLSNLETNQELKSALLEETPWVLNAKDETERKKRVALLFDLNRMANELGTIEQKLADRQLNDGAFTWFPGMKDDSYITKILALGFGHLKKLGVPLSARISNMMEKALPYLDNENQKEYRDLKRYTKAADMDNDHLSYSAIQYLYMRSFYPEKNVGLDEKEAYNYYYGQAKKHWLSKSNYMKGMIAIFLMRGGDEKLAKEIIESLRQNAVFNEEMGMYWKDNATGYWWYEAPIETQALLIEAFDEVAKDSKSVEEMKIWLLKNKQTCDWKTTRATVDACNALLMTGNRQLESTEMVEVKLGNTVVNPYTRPDAKVEAGTGYYKTAFQPAEITPDFGKITVTKKDAGIAWGAVYWQYFEQLDKIKYAATPLAIRKQVFVERNTATGPVIDPISSGAKIKQGDKIKIRIEIRVDRDMEYVHLKDMRAAGFEPVSTLSQYKYQDGLGYYESTRDLATHFFIGYLPKGTYVFEYALRATHKGDFSNGITTMQSMYAPEFTTHSEGIRVVIE